MREMHKSLEYSRDLAYSVGLPTEPPVGSDMTSCRRMLREGFGRKLLSVWNFFHFHCSFLFLFSECFFQQVVALEISGLFFTQKMMFLQGIRAAQFVFTVSLRFPHGNVSRPERGQTELESCFGRHVMAVRPAVLP